MDLRRRIADAFEVERKRPEEEIATVRAALEEPRPLNELHVNGMPLEVFLARSEPLGASIGTYFGTGPYDILSHTPPRLEPELRRRFNAYTWDQSPLQECYLEALKLVSQGCTSDRGLWKAYTRHGLPEALTGLEGNLPGIEGFAREGERLAERVRRVPGSPADGLHPRPRHVLRQRKEERDALLPELREHVESLYAALREAGAWYRIGYAHKHYPDLVAPVRGTTIK